MHAKMQTHTVRYHQPKVGDWAWPVSPAGNAHRVVKVARNHIWLSMGDATIGPFHRENYAYTRKEEQVSHA